MKESHERSLSLKINRSEEGAFMDLLKFMYSDTLSARSVSDLLAVLMLADKFEVTYCVRYCSSLLKEMKMSLDSAVMYIEIPSTVLVEEIQSLVDKAKEFLIDNYADWRYAEEQREEALALPLSAIEVVLSDELTAGSEEDVYEFILKWGRAHYSDQIERRQVITELMARSLLFPYLRISTLKEIQESTEFDSKKMSELIIESLCMNTGHPVGEMYRVPRRWDPFPIKETQFGSCHVVYFHIGTRWFDGYDGRDWRGSQVFSLGGLLFRFRVRIEDEDDYLGLYLERVWGKNGTCTFDYELEVETISDGESRKLERILKLENCCLSVGNFAGTDKLFRLLGVPWEYILNKQDYSATGFLQLRAEFTINDSHPLG